MTKYIFKCETTEQPKKDSNEKKTDITLHGFVLHGSDVFETRWRDIPVLLHLLLLLTVWRTAVEGREDRYNKSRTINL